MEQYPSSNPVPTPELPDFATLSAQEAEGYAYAMKPYEDAAAASRLNQADIYDEAHKLSALGGPLNSKASAELLAEEYSERINSNLGKRALELYHSKGSSRFIGVDREGNAAKLVGPTHQAEKALKYTQDSRTVPKIRELATEYKTNNPKSDKIVQRHRAEINLQRSIEKVSKIKRVKIAH